MVVNKKMEPYWKRRSKHGRDKLFASPEKMWEAACEYFANCDADPWTVKERVSKSVKAKEKSSSKEVKTRKVHRPYTLAGVCVYMGCSTSYFRYMRSVYDPEMDSDFLTVMENICTVVDAYQQEGGLNKTLDASMVARIQGLTDKKDISSTDGSMTPKETTVVVKDKKTADEVDKLINGDD